MDKVRLNFDVDKKIDLTFENDNKIKVLMLKGDDGFNPKVVTARDGDKVTVSITDASGTKTFDITDGYTPTVEARKEDGITTINITNASGTTTTEIHDGADLTGGVPTGAVIGFDGTEADIPNGFEKSSETFGGGTNIPQQAEAPSNPQKDDLWIDTDDNKFQRYTGEEWQNIGGAGGEVLPVGAEIDFDGTSTDIPTGWEETTDPESYSTDEVKTNKTWIDGKPIYRKSFNGNFNDSQDILSNVDKIISVYGQAFVGDTYRVIPYYEIYNNASYIGTLKLRNNVVSISLIQAGTTMTNTPCFFTIEYTKTTDGGSE